MVTSLVRMTRKIMFGYSDPRPRKKEEKEKKKEKEKEKEKAKKKKEEAWPPPPVNWEDEMRNRIRKEEKRKLRMKQEKRDKDRKKDEEEEEKLSRRRETSIQLLNSFLVTIIAGSLGGAITEMTWKNNNHHKLLIISTLMFFGSVVLYAFIWCFLSLGSRTENWIIWLTIASVFALAVPGGALVLGLIAMRM